MYWYPFLGILLDTKNQLRDGLKNNQWFSHTHVNPAPPKKIQETRWCNFRRGGEGEGGREDGEEGEGGVINLIKELLALLHVDLNRRVKSLPQPLLFTSLMCKTNQTARETTPIVISGV